MWTRREGSFLDLLLEEPSFLDDSPGLEWMLSVMQIKDGYHRRVSAGAVDVQTGDFVIFDQTNTPYD